MSKFHLKCCCLICRIELTVQNLSGHNKKCTSLPKYKCQHCGETTNNVKFCSKSCSAKKTNTLRVRKIQPIILTTFERTLLRFNEGLIKERPTIRKCLSHVQGYKCSTCGVSDWNDSPITLIVDHVDGNAGNNAPSNLRLLCPNCNSQTSTFGGRNKGNGRKSRGLPLN